MARHSQFQKPLRKSQLLLLIAPGDLQLPVDPFDRPVDGSDTFQAAPMTLTFWRRVSDWHMSGRPTWLATLSVRPAPEHVVRLPLRRQILLPLLAIVALCVVGVSAAHVWLTTRLLQHAVDEQIRSVAKTLNESTFPLETNVLKQVHGLSGAELVVVDPETESALAASSQLFQEFAESHHSTGRLQRPEDVSLDQTVTVGGSPYFVAAARLDRRAVGGREQRLELYYPERTFREARWQAIYPSLIVGGTALVLAVLFAGVVAARVTEPVQILKQQTEQIAGGDFRPVAPPSRDDEIRDLALSVNRMAEMLSASARQIQQHERTTTLHQIGAGIAHQLRNAATGCRMAIDLFRRQPRQHPDDEHLEIATRQLTLMESYLQRFLILGRSSQQTKSIVLSHDLIASAVALVTPLASHLHVDLSIADATSDQRLQIDRTAVEQALVNILTNAIEASASQPAACVRLRVTAANDRCVIGVLDNGRGLATSVAARLGEPFVTSKPEGTGLGLTVAREVLTVHGGTLRWQREAGWTVFELELPVLASS